MASSKNRIEKLLIQTKNMITTYKLLLKKLIEKKTSTPKQRKNLKNNKINYYLSREFKRKKQ